MTAALLALVLAQAAPAPVPPATARPEAEPATQPGDPDEQVIENLELLEDLELLQNLDAFDPKAED
jgi:hypothetical protein